MSLISFEDALSRVLDGVKPLEAENIPLEQAAGRILAADVRSRRTQPPFDVSAMDGYAARASDLDAGIELRIAGASAAGHPFSLEMKPGEAVRIFTGAVVPQGADTVVPQELAKADEKTVRLPSTKQGKNIRRAGNDFREGDVLLSARSLVTPRDIGAAAAMDHANLSVIRRPRVAVFSTGDELVMPGAGGTADQIVASNPYSVGALGEREGATIVRREILTDSLDKIAGAIGAAAQDDIDVIVTLGGASVGDHDLIRPALEKLGANIAFHRIALRPGRPTLSGELGRTRIIGLPGNPTSAFVCAVIFLVPLLRKLQARDDIDASLPAVLGVDLWANDERADFLRGSMRRDAEGRLLATPFDKSLQDSALNGALARADCLVFRPPYAPAARVGDPCRIIPLD